MSNVLIVYSTARAIRSAIAASSQTLLPTTLSIGEFYSRVDIKKDRFIPDDDLRLLALYEACDFDNFKNLSFEREFFSFIDNSSYIFNFLEELEKEQVDINTLLDADVYAEFEEHINILKTIRTRYKEIVDKKLYNDPIFINEDITIDSNFLLNYQKVIIHIDGYPSRYEIELLHRCSSVVETQIAISISRFNTKLLDRLNEMGFDLKIGYSYLLNLSTKTIIQSEALDVNKNIYYEEFESKISQIGFIKSKVEQFISSGVVPEKIVVILPDESMSVMLELFDKESNFNFAMGITYKNSSIYKTLQTIELYFNSSSNIINIHRLAKIETELIEWIKKHLLKPFDYTEFLKLREFFIDGKTKELEILDSELEDLKYLESVLRGYSFKEVYKLFLNRLSTKTIDDTRGGKITVMGLLESRGAVFDGVIVVDFNESYAPKHLSKDLFLNTKIKEFASLPTTKDRESLQKHYYYMLFNSAKEVAISCVNSATATPSRFLKELRVVKSQKNYDYSSALFKHKHILKMDDIEYEGEYDFSKTKISASKLKRFLSCKRAFYYRYIAGIKEHKIPSALASESDIGTLLHSSLKELYSKYNSFNNLKELRENFEKFFKISQNDDSVTRFSKRYYIDRLSGFFESEIERFSSGYKVLACEKTLEVNYNGLTLSGIIDRVDIKDNNLLLLDYKSGSFADVIKPPKDDEIDFQLDIYELLASSIGEIEYSGYYELKSGKIFTNLYSKERREILHTHLEELKSNHHWYWSKSEDIKACRFCPYVFMCGREAYRNV